MEKEIKVATVGAGYFSQFHYRAWTEISNVQLVGICNRNKEKADRFAEQYNIASVFDNFQEMLDTTQPDIVDVITPPETHEEYVRAAVDRGIAVICQKPFTTSLSTAEKLCDYIDQKNGKVVIHENFRFQPWYRHIKKMLDANVLGEVYQATFRLRPGDGQGPGAYLERQPYFQDMERFLVHETAIHWVDTFRFLFGEISSVFASLRKLNPVIAGEDAGLVFFSCDNNIQAVFDGNRLVDHRSENTRLTMGEMLIEGSKGSITLNGDGEISFRGHGHSEVFDMEYKWKNVGFGGNCVFNLQQHVIDCRLSGETPVNSAKEYLTNIRIEEAIYKSHQSRACVDLHSKNL